MFVFLNIFPGNITWLKQESRCYKTGYPKFGKISQASRRISRRWSVGTRHCFWWSICTFWSKFLFYV